MEVAALAFPWETLSKRDPRRDGHGDGVKGVYLGELVGLAMVEDGRGWQCNTGLNMLRRHEMTSDFEGNGKGSCRCSASSATCLGVVFMILSGVGAHRAAVATGPGKLAAKSAQNSAVESLEAVHTSTGIVGQRTV